MDSIDVSDLPEPFAQAVKAVAETFRRQLSLKRAKCEEFGNKTIPMFLSVCGGAVIGNLSRLEIYDDRL